jgi:hypothetical protein
MGSVNPLVAGSSPAGPTKLVARAPWIGGALVGLCVICATPLRGRQGKFCGRRCKNRYTNYHHQSYLRQQARGRERKLALIDHLGGRCSICGYCRNHAALEFHHRDPKQKAFQLDLRSLANLQWVQIVAEASKCQLLCSNCHAELHNPLAALPNAAHKTKTPPGEGGVFAVSP